MRHDAGAGLELGEQPWPQLHVQVGKQVKRDDRRIAELRREEILLPELHQTLHAALSRECFFAIIDEAKKYNLPVVGHTPVALNPVEVSDAGIGNSGVRANDPVARANTTIIASSSAVATRGSSVSAGRTEAYSRWTTSAFVPSTRRSRTAAIGIVTPGVR